MAEATAFFERLATTKHEPLLEKAHGTVGLEVVRGKQVERWLLTIDDGDLDVSRSDAAADCVVRADAKLFEGIARGEVNVMAAVLRGAIAVEGDPALLVLVQRLVPSPPSAPRRRSSAAAGRTA